MSRLIWRLLIITGLLSLSQLNPVAFGHHIPPPPPEMKRIIKKGQVAPNFTLIDHKGRRVSLKDWRGKIILLGFTLTDCPDLLCEVFLGRFVNIQIDLEKDNKLGKDLILAAITVDPVTDPPEVLNRYAKEKMLGPDGVHLLSGKPEKVRKVLRKYGVLVTKEGHEFTYPHSITVFIGRDGIVEDVFYEDDAISDRIIDRVRELLFMKTKR